jgi:hypothetical protein
MTENEMLRADKEYQVGGRISAYHEVLGRPVLPYSSAPYPVADLSQLLSLDDDDIAQVRNTSAKAFLKETAKLLYAPSAVLYQTTNHQFLTTISSKHSDTHFVRAEVSRINVVINH